MSIARSFRLLGLALGFAFAVSFGSAAALGADETEAAKPATTPVSFYREVRPILQRRCSGCHQPAKAGGKLQVTSYAALLQGGENGEGFIPGKPEESLLIEYIEG